MNATVSTERTDKGFRVVAEMESRVSRVRGAIIRNRSQFGLYIDGVPNVERHASFPAALSAFQRRASGMLATSH